MSTLLAIENLGAGARKLIGGDLSRMVVRVRTGLLRIGLLGLVAVAACHVVPGDADPSPSATAVGSTPPLPRTGEFSGTYHDGLPVYLFPTIYVIGTRGTD